MTGINVTTEGGLRRRDEDGDLTALWLLSICSLRTMEVCCSKTKLLSTVPYRTVKYFISLMLTYSTCSIYLFSFVLKLCLTFGFFIFCRSDNISYTF